jgi:hydroxymethylbilane synthase
VTGTGRALRIGTRRSPLALAQARLVAAELESAGAGPVELVPMTTAGDNSQAPLAQIGGSGVFVTTLRAAVLAGEVDAAVHSLKDLPVDPAAGLVLAAVPVRENPSDVLIARDSWTVDQLPPDAVVGTGSPRRVVQLRMLRPDVRTVDVRGNVDTRVRRVLEGYLDAVVLARAGLARLGRLEVVTDVFGPDRMLPAPGQGALAIECRADDLAAAARLSSIDHPASRSVVTAERALLARLEAGCSAAVGALAVHDPDGIAGTLALDAVVGMPDGTTARSSRRGRTDDAAGLGRELAEELLQAGPAGADRVWGVRTL